MTRLSSGGFCSKWFSPPKRFFGVFPKQFLTLVSQSPAVSVFWANGSCFRKGSVEGSANYSWIFTFVSQSPPGVKVASIVDMSLYHPYKSSPQKTIMSLLLGYSLGLFFFEGRLFAIFCYQVWVWGLFLFFYLLQFQRDANIHHLGGWERSPGRSGHRQSLWEKLNANPKMAYGSRFWK